MRWQLGAVAVGVILFLVVACGSGPGPETTPRQDTSPGTVLSTPPSTGETTSTTVAPAPSTSDPPAVSTTSAAEVAPDFALELGGGGTFVLPDETKPVFMVFWAEW